MRAFRLLAIPFVAIVFCRAAAADVLLDFQQIDYGSALGGNVSFQARFNSFDDLTNGAVLPSDYLSVDVSDPSVLLGQSFFYPFLGVPIPDNYAVRLDFVDAGSGLLVGSSVIGGWNGPFDHYGSYTNGTPYFSFTLSEYAAAPVPEPATALLFGAGLLALLGARAGGKRRRSPERDLSL